MNARPDHWYFPKTTIGAFTLAGALYDPDPTVRRRAMEGLMTRYRDAVPIYVRNHAHEFSIQEDELNDVINTFWSRRLLDMTKHRVLAPAYGSFGAWVRKALINTMRDLRRQKRKFPDSRFDPDEESEQDETPDPDGVLVAEEEVALAATTPVSQSGAQTIALEEAQQGEASDFDVLGADSLDKRLSAAFDLVCGKVDWEWSKREFIRKKQKSSKNKDPNELAFLVNSLMFPLQAPIERFLTAAQSLRPGLNPDALRNYAKVLESKAHKWRSDFWDILRLRFADRRPGATLEQVTQDVDRFIELAKHALKTNPDLWPTQHGQITPHVVDDDSD